MGLKMGWRRTEIIGLAGRAGVGKDTAARFIQEQHPAWQIVAFADPLRRIAADLYDLTHEQMTDRALKERPTVEWGLSPRQILQRLGTEVVRAVHPKTWIFYALRTIADSDAPGVIIPDVRFDNEVDLVRNLGGRLWWIDRPAVDPIAKHSSEQQVGESHCDVVIRNDGTLQQFQLSVQNAL